MRKRYVPTVLAAGLIGGTALGAVAFNPFVSSADAGLELAAQTDEVTTTTTVVESDDANEATDESGPGRRGEWLAEVLAPLVADGTITQAQADAVTAALVEAAPPPGRHGGRPGFIHGGLDAASTALGITEAELRTELRDGSTIAEVAAERSIDVQTVIDAMVADATARIDEKVASGDITAERAAEIKADLVERVTAVVNGEGGGFGRGGPGPWGPGPWGGD